MARSAVACCSATVLLLLAVLIFTSGASSEPLTAVLAADHAGDGEKSNLLPVDQDTGSKDEEKIKGGEHRGEDAGEIASLASTEKEDKKAGFKWAKANKLDVHKDDPDSDSDSDHDSDSSSDSGSDTDSDSDSDSDSDDDEDSNNDNSRHGKKEAPGGKHDGLFMKQ